MFTIAVCDDEETFGEQIRSIVWKVSDEFEEKTKVLIFTSGEKLLKYMQQHTVDLLFLDIELEQMTGIQVSHKIRKEEGNEWVQIVFITGKEGYERKLFDFQPLNFISKPLNEEKIKECIRKAYQRLEKGGKKFHYVSRYEEYFISMNQIISFETEGKNIVMNLLQGKELFRSSMKQVEEQIAGTGFLKISQSVIVNMDYIAQYDGTIITMTNSQKYYVSRSQIKKVKQKYMEYVLEHGKQ